MNTTVDESDISDSKPFNIDLSNAKDLKCSAVHALPNGTKITYNENSDSGDVKLEIYSELPETYCSLTLAPKVENEGTWYFNAIAKDGTNGRKMQKTTRINFTVREKVSSTQLL